ncbi:hypothetical protein FV141_09170 [Dermacoccus abyssi]|uniref:DUF4254 domain-containing protein n=1 Tax=Dermacoccus abyssi TaxID=322596 RepID=A0ABX5Z9P4_9MICO|nr:hypothetical protein FV141_09170 [Dermacoccus abyssi]
MPADSLTSRDTATRLTRCALRLLDIPFDPATALNGEAFDRVVESLSEQLSDAASAELAGRPAPTFVAPRLDPLPPLVTRRAQAGLRRQIESGRLPGNPVTVRRATEGIDDIRDELRTLLDGEARPEHSDGLVTSVADALERLGHILATYRHGYLRLGPLITKQEMSLEALGDSATRLERFLTRCLDRVGDDRMLR